MVQPRNVFGTNGEKIGCFFFGHPAQNGSTNGQKRTPLPAHVKVSFVLDRRAAHLESTLFEIFEKTGYITQAMWQEHPRQQSASCIVATLIVEIEKMGKKGRNPQQIVNALGNRTQLKLRKNLQAVPA